MKVNQHDRGLRLRKIREGLKLSRKGFCELTGINSSSLEAYETGQRMITPSKARLFSLIFTYRFRVPSEQASEEYILNGDT